MRLLEKRWFEWMLLVVAVLLAAAANLPESVVGPEWEGQKFVVWALFLILLFALIKYVKFALVTTVFVLSIGANLPENLARNLGISDTVLLVTLGTLVVLWGLNARFHFLPSGVSSLGHSVQTGGTGALMGAIYSGNTQEVNRLLRSGISPNVRTKTNRTPLMLAVAIGYSDIVRLLLHSGADVGVRDQNGETALSVARRRGATDLVDELIRAGALE